MPTYDYKCADCGAVFEYFHGMNEVPQISCPFCQSTKVSKQIGLGAGVIFKGSGFYVTDYKKNGADKKIEKPSQETKTVEKSHTCTGACSH